jgi:Transposase DDE domain
MVSEARHKTIAGL